MEIFYYYLTHTQVPLVRCVIPLPLLPAIPIPGVWHLHGWVEGDGWDWHTGHYGDCIYCHGKLSPGTKTWLFATHTAKLGLSSSLDDLTAAT